MRHQRETSSNIHHASKDDNEGPLVVKSLLRLHQGHGSGLFKVVEVATCHPFKLGEGQLLLLLIDKIIDSDRLVVSRNTLADSLLDFKDIVFNVWFLS